MTQSTKVLELTIVPVQRQVEVGALAVEENPNAYPDLYREFKSKVDPAFHHEFVCVTWLHDNKWHGQPDGFYHRARFKQSKVRILN